MLVRAYFILGGEPGSVGLVPVLREVPKSTAVAKAAMTALLAGPTRLESGDRQISTAIPDGTTLLGVSAKNGVATVNLSTEYDSGGGSASMQYRLAQVVYTLTQFATIKSVVFQIDGETVTAFGSEGIVLDGPVGRADYYDQLPAIFVDRPAFRAGFASGGRVSGNADVFEATFRVDDPRRGRHTARRRSGHGQLRERMPGDVQHDPQLQGRQGPVGHAARVRALSKRRDTHEYP